MKIELKRLTLTNFKGIRSLTIAFSQVTDILGQNATGKSTLMDAFLWLLFGKDSSDRKDFEIKTLDENNEPYHRLDHEVAALITVDGEELNLRRVYKEKWVTKRGEKDKVFSGHETDFYWNDVPLKLEDYQTKIAGILNESVFKLITNTGYFNSLKWQDRRNVLLQIAGHIDDTDVLDKISTLQNKSQVGLLTAALNKKKTIEEFRKEIAAKKLKIKNDLIQFPSRIDEANRSLPDEKNYKEIDILISQAMADLDTTESLLMTKTQAQKQRQEEVSKKIQEVGEFRAQLQRIEFDKKNAVMDSRRSREQVILDLKRELRIKQDELSRSIVDYSTEEKRKSGLEVIAKDLRTKWEKINNEKLEFSDEEFHCPACKRAFETSDIQPRLDELTANFNTDRSKRLAEVTERGKSTAQDIKVLEAKLGNLKTDGSALRVEIGSIQNKIAVFEEENTRLSGTEDSQVKEAILTDTEHKAISEMIVLRNEEINTPAPGENNTELLQRKRDLNARMDGLKKELSTKEQREKTLARIEELKTQESNMAQEMADLEGVDYCIDQFTKAKMDMLESRINGRFKIVKFKMFNVQINGGLEETCETLINGVPFPDANTASKINAGLDVINTLSDHYGVTAPIFIDNRESVIKISESRSQIINLIVSASHKKLTVGEGQLEMAEA